MIPFHSDPPWVWNCISHSIAGRVLKNGALVLATGNQAAMTGNMRLKERSECDVEIFGLSCEIDIHYAPTLRAMFRRKIEARCKALILDLTDVYHLDSGALMTFIEYHQDAGGHGGVLCLCGVNEGLKPIFDTVQRGRLLPIFETVAEAVAAIAQRKIQPYHESTSVADQSSRIALSTLSR